MNALLSARGLVVPDGRPLHAYRFTKDEVEGVATLLRRFGRMALQDRVGRALILAHVAEWFRRERTGGHWDWIRHLRSIGLRYGPGQMVQYSDVEELVRGGLQAWRRPQPPGGERLLAVVRESGFPVAAVRDDPRISAWLRHAVVCTERGFRAEQAVAAEAWRVSERLADSVMSIEDNIEYLSAHRQVFKRLADRSLAMIRELDLELVSTGEEVRSKSARLRALKSDLIAPSHAASAAFIEERLRLEQELIRIGDAKVRFEQQLDALNEQAGAWRDMLAERAELPEARLSEEDVGKLSKLETSIRSQLVKWVRHFPRKGSHRFAR